MKKFFMFIAAVSFSINVYAIDLDSLSDSFEALHQTQNTLESAPMLQDSVIENYAGRDYNDLTLDINPDKLMVA